jgi:hypothetical protein
VLPVLPVQEVLDMAGRLISVGEVTYNGITFPPALSSKALLEPQYDPAHRVVRWTEINLTVEFVVTTSDLPIKGTTSADNSLELIRIALSEAGGPLTFMLQGFGFVAVNVPEGATVGTSVYGLNYTPQPSVLVWEPIGANRAVRVVWTCRIQLENCLSTYSRAYPWYPHSYNWEASWNINEDGMSVRSINGELTLAGYYSVQFAGNYHDRINIAIKNYVYIMADLWREKISQNILPIPGFRRNQEWSLDKTKAVLRFRIQDTEIPSPNPYPPYVVDMDIDHSMSSSFGQKGLYHGQGMRTWRSSISGNVKLAPCVGRNHAYNVFIMVVKDRLSWLSIGHPDKPPVPGMPEEIKPNESPEERAQRLEVKKNCWYFPISLTMKEKIFRREFSFTFEYLVGSRLEDLWKSSRIFMMLDDTVNGKLNWDNHSLSLAVDVHHSRGSAGLRLTPTGTGEYDLLVNSCSYANSITSGGNYMSGTLPSVSNARLACVPPNIPPDQPQQPVPAPGSPWASPDRTATGPVGGTVIAQSTIDAAKLFTPAPATPEQSWIDFYNAFYILEIPNTVAYARIRNVSDENIHTQSVYTNAAAGGFQIANNVSNTGRDANPHSIQIRGDSQYIVTMVGYAVRAYYSIPTPTLQSFAGQPAYREGGEWSHREYVRSNTSPIYVATWRIPFRITGLVSGTYLSGNAVHNAQPQNYA